MAEKRKEVKNENTRLGLILGLVLVLIGSVFMLSELEIITFNPFILTLIIGLTFIGVYVLYDSWPFIIPGIILSGTSLIFLTKTSHLTYLYSLVVGLSFLTVYLTRKEGTNWAWIPAVILIAISAFALFEFYMRVSIWPFLLILAGAYIILKNYRNKI